MKITTKEARAFVNKRLERINEHIANTQAEPDYFPGDENTWYFMADGVYGIVGDLGILTQADKDALSKKISEARKLHSKIKLIGQR